MKLEDTRLMKVLNERESDFVSQIENLYIDIEPLLNQRIAQVFPEYTQHDSQHSFRIMEHMYDVISDVEPLNDFEIALLIYSALLHDIGMAASSDEIHNIKNGKLKYSDLSFRAILKKFNNDETLAIQDFLRRVHADRSANYIKTNLKETFFIKKMKSITFEEDIALICESHTKDISWIVENVPDRKMKSDYEYNLKYLCMVLRLGDILDFDSQRTPWKLYQTIKPQGYSNGEWLQHYSIANDKKIKTHNNGQKIVEMHGTCSNAKIHRKILSYIDWINNELENANDLTKNFDEKYKLHFYHKVNNFIQSKNYALIDLKFTVNYHKILDLLMGEELYGNKELGMREIIQNSIDACMLRKEIYDKTKAFHEEDFKASIKIILDKDNNVVKVSDNGTGMNLNIIKNYFLELGASFYTSDEFKLNDYLYKPIGNYGIGFLASFMLSNTIKVKTRHFKDSITNEIEVLKDDEYICIRQYDDYGFEGTEITLEYDKFFEVWKEVSNLKEFLEKNFLSSNYEIILIDNSLKNRNIIKPKYRKSLEEDTNIINLNSIKMYFGKHSRIDDIFVRKLSDLEFIGEAFVYKDNELYKLEDNDNFEIVDFLDNGELEVLNIMMVEDAESLQNILDYADDFDEAKEKYENKFNPEYITIIAEPETLYNAPTGYAIEQEILEDLHLDEIEDSSYIYHNNEYGTFFEKEKFKLFKPNDEKNEIYIPLNHIKERYYQDYRYEKRVYVRDVYVKNIPLNQVENSMLYFNVNNMVIDIENPVIIPNVNRTSLKEDLETRIIYTVYQALCEYICNELNDTVEKNIFNKYMKEFDFISNGFPEEFEKVVIY